MLNQMKIPVRLVLLGGFPMAALALVLLLSFQLSNQKDLLFDRLYQHHILALNDLLLIQRLTQKPHLTPFAYTEPDGRRPAQQSMP